MRALITGGSGFIGAQLARLLTRGATRRPSLTCSRPPRHGGTSRSATPLCGLGHQPARLIDAIGQHRADTVFHLGGMLSMPCERDPWGAFEVNVAGTYHLFEAARLGGASGCCFPAASRSSARPARWAITDHSLQRPASMYGTSKVFGELLGRFYARASAWTSGACASPRWWGRAPRCLNVHLQCWAIERPCWASL